MLPHRRLWPFVLVATIATFALYWPSLSFDLFADDYLYLRPWTWIELQQAWAGPWLPFPTAPPFYRPVATTMYFVMFALFGVNSAALHWLTLPVMIGAATLVGLCAARALQDDRAGWLGTLLFVLFPGSVTSIGPWIVNQYHGLLVITAASAWLLWPRTPDAPLRRWVWIGLLCVVAAWTKEDGLMLPLALAGGQVASRWWSGDRPLPLRVPLTAAALFAALFVWRLVMLGSFGGYDWWPPASEMALNLIRGIAWVPAIQRGTLPASALASVFTMALCLTGAWRAWRSPAAPESRLFVVAGVVLAIVLVPHALMTSVTRGHLLTLASVLMLTAALAPLLHGGRLLRAGLVVGFISLAAVAHERLLAFAPCSEEAKFELSWVIPDVRAFGPPEMASWLESLPACAPGTPRRLASEVDTLTWGVSAPSTHVVLLAHQNTQSLRWTVSADQRQKVTLFVDGQLPRTVEVGPDPVVLDVAVTPTWRSALRRMHRLDLVAPSPLRWRSAVETVRRPAGD